MSTLIEAAGVDVESIWPTIFAKALAGKDIGALLMNVGAGMNAFLVVEFFYMSI